MFKPKRLGSSNLDAPLRSGPSIARCNPQHNNKQSISVLRCPDGFSILCIDHTDKIGDDGKDIFLTLVAAVGADLDGGDVLVLEWDLDGPLELL
ncbi:hypothetical protein HG530_003119 [Fusarium avenaceum]|nr:hypothetical protein HG530_003119 [Fusarium avenaceum]